LKHLTSANNPALKRVAELMDSAVARREAGRMVLEGSHLLETCVAAWGAGCVESLLLREDLPEASARRINALAPSAEAASVETRTFARLSPVAGDNGVLAVARIPIDAGDTNPGGLELWLDEVQDPGNAGAIVRTAAAAGATRVVFGRGSADPWSPKCLRGGMGGHFLCRIEQDDDLEKRAERYGGRLVATSPANATDLFTTDLSGDLVILLGAEGRGLSPALEARAQLRVWIPVASGTESLNVGAAAAVLCFERVRQLRSAGQRPA
jgi:TrmH family RNA methyltransferase